MAKKKFMLRIDEETMRAVEAWAAEEFRSVNGQLEWIITRALQRAGRLPKSEKERASMEKSPKKGASESD